MVDASEVRFLPARDLPVPRCTDLGSVQVLKHGNRYLLTDAFGDIHPDSRGLGLYEGDTRLLSCCVLRVGGERPVLLQTSVGGNYRGGIQLTNPSVDRNPDAKVHPMDELVGRTVGIGRQRVIGGDGMEERLRVENHASREVALPVVIGLGADSADIFEVRGFPRLTRGRLLPVAVADGRVTFRYDGLDGLQLLVHVAFSEPPLEVRGWEEGAAPPDGTPDDYAALHLTWDLHLGPGEERDLTWTIWATRRPSPERRRDVDESCRAGGTVPGTAARVERRGRVRVSRLGASDDDRHQRSRAAQPRHQALDQRPAPARQRRAGARPALHRRGRAVVQHAVRAGRAHHGLPVARGPAAASRWRR